MLLTVDVGNSTIKCGLFQDEDYIGSWRIATDRDKSSDEYGLQMSSFFDYMGRQMQEVEAVIMASVVPGLHYTLDRMAKTFFNVTPMVVTSEINSGLVIKYDLPSTLGADRIANAAAAYELFGGPCITVDFGTATSFGAVNEKGEFLGGAIAPGIRSATDALTTRAAMLHRFDFVKPSRAIATNTVEAMQAGAIFGFAGLADNIIRHMKAEMPGAKVIATGGLSDVIKNESDTIDVVDKLLTLKGLRIIYEKNS